LEPRLELLSFAIILGLNLGGKYEPGWGGELKETLGCVKGYDIQSKRFEFNFDTVKYFSTVELPRQLVQLLQYTPRKALLSAEQ